MAVERCTAEAELRHKEFDVEVAVVVATAVATVVVAVVVVGAVPRAEQPAWYDIPKVVAVV